MNSNDQSEVNASERLDTSVWDREISRRTVLLGGAALLAAPWLLGSCGSNAVSFASEQSARRCGRLTLARRRAVPIGSRYPGQSRTSSLSIGRWPGSRAPGDSPVQPRSAHSLIDVGTPGEVPVPPDNTTPA